MTQWLQKEQLANLHPNQSVYDQDGEEWVVEVIRKDEFTYFVVIHKRDNEELMWTPKITHQTCDYSVE